MMQSMRDNMKVIIWVTAIVFLVGFGILQLGGVLNPPSAAGPAGVIAKINGEPVRYQEFMGTYQNIVNQVRQQREPIGKEPGLYDSGKDDPAADNEESRVPPDQARTVDRQSRVPIVDRRGRIFSSSPSLPR